jgi:hypothetical protein
MCRISLQILDKLASFKTQVMQISETRFARIIIAHERNLLFGDGGRIGIALLPKFNQ